MGNKKCDKCKGKGAKRNIDTRLDFTIDEYANAPKPFRRFRKQKSEEIGDILHQLQEIGNTKDFDILDIDIGYDINVCRSESMAKEKKITENNIETKESWSECDSEPWEDPLIRSRDWWNSDGKCDEAPKLECYKDSWDSD